MKMVLLRYLTAFICAMFITTGTASGEDVKKAVGDQVSFRPDKFIPPVTSIIWKHRNADGNVDKVIVWGEGDTETWIPIQRFKGITTVDEKTGQINITNLKVEHSGVYTIDINSKEQQQRFTLTVMERVPKPVIKLEQSVNPDVVYLRCEYSELIIWKNSAGETLTGSPITPKGESITVKNEGNPENFYTCTLKNTVSEETSDLLYKRDLFEDGSKHGYLKKIGFTVIIILIIIGCSLFFLYKRNNHFQNLFDDRYEYDKGLYSSLSKHDESEKEKVNEEKKKERKAGRRRKRNVEEEKEKEKEEEKKREEEENNDEMNISASVEEEKP